MDVREIMPRRGEPTKQSGPSPAQIAWRHAFILTGQMGPDGQRIDQDSDYDRDMRNRSTAPDTKSISDS